MDLGILILGESDRMQPKSNSMPQGLAVYIVTVVALAIGAVFLISQRAAIISSGHEMATMRREAAQEETAVSRLKLRLARMKSAERLAAEARRLGLHIVPPEDRLSASASEEATAR